MGKLNLFNQNCIGKAELDEIGFCTMFKIKPAKFKGYNGLNKSNILKDTKELIFLFVLHKINKQTNRFVFYLRS